MRGVCADLRVPCGSEEFPAVCKGVSSMAGEAHIGDIPQRRAAVQLAEAPGGSRDQLPAQGTSQPQSEEVPVSARRRKVKLGYLGQKTSFQPDVTMQI